MALDETNPFQSLFEHAGDGIFVAKLDGRIVEVNRAACRLLGYDRDQLVGMHPWDFVVTASKADILGLWQGLPIGTTASVERVYRHKSGEQRVLDLRLARYAGNSGDLIVASCRDVTEHSVVAQRLEALTAQRETELELQRVNSELEAQTQRLEHANVTLMESEQRLRLAIETGKIGLWVWNSTDLKNVGDWTPRLKEIFGLPPEIEVTHGVFLECVHADDRRRVDESIRRALSGADGGEYQAEYRIIHRNGIECWVTARGRAFFNAQGVPVRFIGTVMDTTEQKRVEEDLLREKATLEELGQQSTEQLARTHLALQKALAASEASESQLRKLLEILRASERVASGQLDALKYTLNALTKESELDKLLELVLRKIAEEMIAESVSVWRRSETDDLTLLATFEAGQVFYPTKGAPENQVVSMKTSYHPVWRAAFESGEDCVLADLEQDPPRIRLTQPDAPWYAWDHNSPQGPEVQSTVRRHVAGGVKGTLSVPMLFGGKAAGMVGIRIKRPLSFRPEEMELARALSHQAMFAIRLIQLSGDSRNTAVIAERNRLARDIHDTLAQSFTGVIVQMEAAADARSKGLMTEFDAHLAQVSGLAREGLREARRSLQALRPEALERMGLRRALNELFHKMTSGAKLRVAFSWEGEEMALPSGWEENILRIAQEVLTNALRHSQADEFVVVAASDAEQFRLDVSDNGAGFDPALKHDGFGLTGIRERVGAMGGRLLLRSAPGHGTSLAIAVPFVRKKDLPPL